jgi:hypothetical protein
MSRRRKKSGGAASGSDNGGSATLERQVRDLELSVKKQGLERQLGISESAIKTVNRMDWLPNFWGGANGGFGGGGLAMGGLTERRDGNNAPFVMTEEDLRQQRAFARLVTTAESVGVGIVKTLTDYVIGDGYIYKAIARRGKQTPDGLLEEVQDVIDEFDEDNKFTGNLDKELYNRDLADGETFLGLHPNQAGRVKARVIEPEYVTDTGNLPLDDDTLYEKFGIVREHADNCTFGLHTPDHDVVDVIGYCVQWDTGTRDYLPKLYVEHSKRNSFQNVKRGMTDFYPVWKWILQQSRILENTGEAAAEQAAIAYIIQHVKGTSKDQVESMVRNNADYEQNVYGQNGTREVSKRHHPPGTHKHISEGMEYQPGPTGHERGSAFLDVVQGILRQVAVRWCHDTDTECLTDSGWKEYDKLSSDDRIGTMNQKTGKLEFQAPTKIHIYDYAGPMVRVKNAKVDMMVTPDHRMYLLTPRGRDRVFDVGRFYPAWDLVEGNRHRQYAIPTAMACEEGWKPESITIPSVDGRGRLNFKKAESIRELVSSGSSIAGTAREFSVTPGAVRQIVSNKTYRRENASQYQDQCFDAIPFIKFIGHFLSEGWTTIQKEQANYRVGLCQGIGNEAFEDIKSSIHLLGHKVFESITPAGTKRVSPIGETEMTADFYQWEVLNKSLCLWLRENCGEGSRNKRIPSQFKMLVPELLEVLLHALWQGDGGNATANVMEYHTASRQLADDVQEIAVRCGYVATVRGRQGSQWRVRFRLADRVGFTPIDNVQISEYVGKVWCVSVPNGTMVTRRHGTVAVSGNCMSEGQISGDDSNNNMASGIVAGSRFHVSCRSEQGMRKQYYRQIFWKVLLFNYHAGRFERFGFAPGQKSWREFKRTIDLQIEAPPINERNKLEEEQIRQIRQAAKVLSRKTWQAQAELDGEVEDKHIQEEAERDAATGKPHGQPPGEQPPVGQPPAGIRDPKTAAPAAGMSDLPSISKELGAPEGVGPVMSRQQIELLVTEMVQSQMIREQTPPELLPKHAVQFHGLTILIENPKGSVRRGVGADGKPWANTMAAHYGEVIGLAGADGDYVDVFLGPNADSELVFVMDQIDQQTGEFDEHKAFLGFNSKLGAVGAYLGSYDAGWKVGPIRAMHIDEFRDWVMTGRHSGAVKPQAGAGSPQAGAESASDLVAECKGCGDSDTGAELSDEAKAFLQLLKQQPANRIVESYP